MLKYHGLFERGIIKMEGFEEQLIAKYNYELSNLLELSKLNPKEIDKIYEENELT